jgi:hypothetical protein
MRPAVLLIIAFAVDAATAQVAPSVAETRAYTGMLAAAARGDSAQIAELVAAGNAVDVRDAYGRTPLHVAAYAGRHAAMRALVKAGADPNALERDRYDIVTIAAVADDLPTLKVALDIGCSARNITSRYDGTALIAAAHLGHAEVVRVLIAAGAPLDLVRLDRPWRPVGSLDDDEPEPEIPQSDSEEFSAAPLANGPSRVTTGKSPNMSL